MSGGQNVNRQAAVIMRYRSVNIGSYTEKSIHELKMQHSNIELAVSAPRPAIYIGRQPYKAEWIKMGFDFECLPPIKQY